MLKHTTPSRVRLDAALFTLRVAFGAIFAAHGAQKLFVFGLDGVAAAFTQMGIPFAGQVGPAVAFLELVGGIALIAGFGTRPVAVALVANMLGALTFVHLAAGFFLPNGYEFVLALASGSAVLALTGPGSWSIDALLALGSADPVELMAAPSVATRRAA